MDNGNIITKLGLNPGPELLKFLSGLPFMVDVIISEYMVPVTVDVKGIHEPIVGRCHLD
jgi:hypothetical protein